MNYTFLLVVFLFSITQAVNCKYSRDQDEEGTLDSGGLGLFCMCKWGSLSGSVKSENNDFWDSSKLGLRSKQREKKVAAEVYPLYELPWKKLHFSLLWTLLLLILIRGLIVPLVLVLKKIRPHMSQIGHPEHEDHTISAFSNLLSNTQHRIHTWTLVQFHPLIQTLNLIFMQTLPP